MTVFDFPPHESQRLTWLVRHHQALFAVVHSECHRFASAVHLLHTQQTTSKGAPIVATIRADTKIAKRCDCHSYSLSCHVQVSLAPDHILLSKKPSPPSPVIPKASDKDINYPNYVATPCLPQVRSSQTRNQIIWGDGERRALWKILTVIKRLWPALEGS